MSYTERQALATDPAFINRTEIAAIEVAIAIAGEDGATDGHAQRFSYAGRVLAQSREQARKLSHGLAAQPGISEDSDDLAIKNSLIAVWNAYAGFNPNA